MKKQLTIIGLVAILCIALTGCFAPLTPVVDPDDPIDAPRTVPVADFFYYEHPQLTSTPPIQTNSWVMFDGSASYDPNDEIRWGKWDFGDDTIEEGIWTTTEKVWENGEWVWKMAPGDMQTPRHKYDDDDPGSYRVTLTVWDYEGNSASTTRKVRVEAMP